MPRIWKGPAFQEPVAKGNLIRFVFKDSHLWKNLRALDCGYTGKTLTYGELQDVVGRWGAWLTRYRGDALHPPVVARFALCSVEVAVVQLGTLAVGAVFTGLVSAAGPRELAAQLDNCNATLVVAAAEFLPRLKEALEKLGRPIPVVVLGDAAASGTAGLTVVATYESIMEDGSLTPISPVELTGEETAQLLYTSGSTGLPKAVQHTHNSLIVALMAVLHPDYSLHQQTTSESSQTRCFLLRDFGLAFAMMCGLLPGLAVGSRLIIKEMDEKTIADDFERFKVNTTLLVPPNLPSLIQMARERPDILENFRSVCVSGGIIPRPLATAMAEVMPGVIVQKCYGTSEAGIIGFDPVVGGKSECTGRVCANVSVKVESVDGSGELMPANQQGILFFKTDGLMKGYLNNPTATRGVIDADGWYNTGDVGVVDEDGFIRVVDRVKELLKLDDACSASPSEIENTILELAGVREVCVVGARKADTSMDAIYAFVVKKPNFDSEITEDCIKKHVVAQLNKQKSLKRVIFLSKLPRNQSDKIHRVLLKSQASDLEKSK